MGRRVLANSLDNYQLAKIAHDVVAERWDNWDLTAYLVYLVDTVEASALPYLAEQFNCEGLRGFTKAATEDDQRELIKASIRLHKFMGTPWAIREACRTVGLPNIILKEGVPSPVPDPATDWANFSLLIDAPDGTPIDFSLFAGLRAFINLYKPERCHLVALGASFEFLESERVMRDKFMHVDELPIYNGDYIYDGTISYGGLRREYLNVEISTESVIYFDVLVDDAGDFLTDDANECITDFMD